MAESSVAAQAYPPRGPATLRLPLVHLRYQGRPIGLYGIRELYEKTLVLLHGPIAFPPGTHLVVEDLLGVYAGLYSRIFPATVTDSDPWGMTLSL